MTTNDILFLILMGVLFIAAVIFIPQFMLMRNIPRVIKIMRQNNAVGAENAKPIDELGLHPKSIFQRMFARRNYKPQALQFLLRATIVEMTDDGNVYLNEQNLMRTRWRNL
jgi:hypothetical protein